MPIFIVIIKTQGEIQPHCALPVEAANVEALIARIEQPVEVKVVLFSKPLTAVVSSRKANDALWRERIASLGSHWGAQKELAIRCGVPERMVVYYKQKFIHERTNGQGILAPSNSQAPA